MSNIPAIRLDPKRAYGEIHPPKIYNEGEPNERQALFSQTLYGTNEEVFFDNDLNIIEDGMTKKAKAFVDESLARKAADEAGERARAAALKAAGLSEKSGPAVPQVKRQRSGTKLAVPPAGSEGEDNDDVDLQAWFDGREKYRFAVVQDYVFEKYNYKGTDANGLKAWLADPDNHNGKAIVKASENA